MGFEIVNDRLVVDGKPVTFTASPNTSGARFEPQLIVLHDTAGSTLDGAVSWFSNRASKVSAHVVIERDGTIVQCVEFDRVAWHAGASSWQGREQCNGFAIGIEIVNPGGLKGTPASGKAEFGKVYDYCVAASSPAHWSKLWLAYTEPQLAAVEALIGALCAAYPRIQGLAGHHDISPGRKEDPTPLMPWERMRSAVGRPRAAGPVAKVDHESVQMAQVRLDELGYGPGLNDGLMGPRTRGAVRTFQDQNRIPINGVLDEATWSRLFVTREDLPAPKEMPLGTRAELTTVKGSRTFFAANSVQYVARGDGALEFGHALGDLSSHALGDLGSSVADAGGLIGQAEGAVALADRVGALVPMLERLGTWITTPAGMKAVGTLLALVLLDRAAEWIKARRLAAARSGKHL